MYILVSKNKFIDTFQSVRPDSFTYEGLNALYEMLTAEEDGIGDELDVIGLCGQCVEYASIEAYNEDNNQDYEDIDELAKRVFVKMIDDESFIVKYI